MGMSPNEQRMLDRIAAEIHGDLCASTITLFGTTHRCSKNRNHEGLHWWAGQTGEGSGLSWGSHAWMIGDSGSDDG